MSRRFGTDNKHKRRKVHAARLERELVEESKKIISLSDMVSRTLNGVSDRYKAPERVYKDLRKTKQSYGKDLYYKLQKELGNNRRQIQIQGNVLQHNVLFDFLWKQEAAPVAIAGRVIDKPLRYNE